MQNSKFLQGLNQCLWGNYKTNISEMNGTRIENLCRTCMSEEYYDRKSENRKRRTVSIFMETESVKNGNITIMELLLLTTPQLHIDKDDMLPKIMCNNCVGMLVKVHEFQQICITTEERFKEIINKQKHINNQNSKDPLKTSILPQTISDCSDLLKIEMDEPLINHNDIIDVKFNNVLTRSDDLNEDSSTGSDDDFNYVTTSDDSELESHIIKTTSKKLVNKSLTNKLKEETKENSNYLDKELDNNSTLSKIQNKNANYEFKCDECGNRLKSRRSLKRHKLIHSKSQVNKDEANNLNDNLSETVNKSNSKKSLHECDKSSFEFECDECGSRLKTRKSLSRHKKIHLRPIGVQKKKQTKIKTHTMNECEYCNKVFQKPSLLKDHIRLHTGELPYLCSECGKSFRKASILKQHLLRHGTDKPHVCTDCPKSFSTISDLASHKAVHKTTKTHVCDVCGAGFVKAFYLKEHKMYHTGEKNHKCEYCDRRFVTGYQCRRHMRTHTGEKPHKCKYCARAYTQSNELMKHLRSHLGDNVYKCSLCPQGFRLHCDLREHFNSHKNDDEETKLRNLKALKKEELRLEIKFGLIEGTS